MGSTLELIGSHKLKFNSGKDVVNQFQSIFNVEIKNGTYESNEVYIHEAYFLAPSQSKLPPSHFQKFL